MVVAEHCDLGVLLISKNPRGTGLFFRLIEDINNTMTNFTLSLVPRVPFVPSVLKLKQMQEEMCHIT